MTFLKKSFLLLFVGVALILSSCGKEEATVSDEELRTQALEELVIDLESITDQEADEEEKGYCSGHGFGSIKATRFQSGGDDHFNYEFSTSGNYNSQWFYFHVDMRNRTMGIPALNNYRLMGGSGFRPGRNLSWSHAIDFPGDGWESRVYLYVWTGSSWCRLDVKYL